MVSLNVFVIAVAAVVWYFQQGSGDQEETNKIDKFQSMKKITENDDQFQQQNLSDAEEKSQTIIPI